MTDAIENLEQVTASALEESPYLQHAKEIEFLSSIENLKKVLRHSWLSDGRRESTAEHSWRLALMAYRYADKLDQPVDTEKCIKMALIHDLAEAKVGDIPVFVQTKQVKMKKFDDEKTAMKEYCEFLSDAQSNEMFAIWMEYENQQTYESKFIKALDKLEAFLQHAEASISTWEEREKRMVFQSKWLIRFCEFDSFLNALCDLVLQKCIHQLKAAGEDIERLIADAIAEEKEWEKMSA
jgi:putative hydrolase of HD superfamily